MKKAYVMFFYHEKDEPTFTDKMSVRDASLLVGALFLAGYADAKVIQLDEDFTDFS